jgi:capsid protein
MSSTPDPTVNAVPGQQATPPEQRAEDPPRPRLPEIPPMIAQAQAAFRRDLAELLQTHYRQWVAYHGERRVGFARTKTELYQRCLKLGLSDWEFVVRTVEPAPDDFEWDEPAEEAPPREQKPSQLLPIEIPPMIAQAQAAFRRDLPELMKTHYRQWVAYHGERRVGFARTKTELYQRCLKLGLSDWEFVVRSVEPEPDEDLDPEELPDV